MIETKDIYWLAGLLEGEGHFVYKKAKETAHIYIEIGFSSTDLDIVKRCWRIFKMGNMNGPYVYRSVEQEIFKWRVSDKVNAASLMMTLYPIMGKRRKAQIRTVLQQWRDSPKHYERRKFW